MITPLSNIADLSAEGRFGRPIAHGVLEREFVLTKQDDTVVQRGDIGLLVARQPAR